MLGVLAAFYVLGYLLPLGARPLMRPDELRYGEIPREMIASGDWTVPRLNGMRYFEKPALGYQWNALNIELFGENAFAVRLAGALSAGLAAVLIYLLVARSTRDARLPGLAAATFLAMGLVFGVSTFAVLDMQLTMALTWCLGAYFFAWQSKKIGVRLGLLALAGAAAGAAFLFKGFLAFAVPVVTIVPFLIWQRDWKKFLTDPWIPIILAVAVALPWSIAIWKAEPDFWNYFFIEEHWKRFTSSTYDREPEPWWYFLPILAGGIMPAGLFIIVGYSGWKNAFFKKPLARFSLCWFLFPFLFFSASSCKLGTYILPCFVPLAILIAWGVRRALLAGDGRAKKRFERLVMILGWLFASVGGWAVLAFILWRIIWVKEFPIYEPDNFWPLLAAVGGVVLGLGMFRLHKQSVYRQMAWMLLGFLPVIWGSVNSMPGANLLHPSKMPEATLRQALEEFGVTNDDVIAADRGAISAICWITGRTDVVVLGKKGEYEYSVTRYPEEYAGRWYPDQDFDKLYKQVQPHRLVFVVLRDFDDDPYPMHWPVKKLYKGKGVTIAGF